MTKKRYVLKSTIYDKKGRVLSVGHNNYEKTHPYQAKLAKIAGNPKQIVLHSEIDALIKCRGEPYKIKIERYAADGSPKMAAPCPICQLAIKRAGIKFIEYTVG